MPTVTDATLVTGQRWTNNTPQITFDAGYSCWRENNGNATYNTWVKINKLRYSQDFFNPPINVEAKITIGSDAAQYFSWSGSTSKTFKANGVATWSAPITYTTDNKSVSVAPDTNVTITIRVYSNSSQGSSRDVTYTYAGIAVPAYTNASLTAVPSTITIASESGIQLVTNITAQNITSTSDNKYTLSASINGNQVGTSTATNALPNLSIDRADVLAATTHSATATIQYALTTKNSVDQQVGTVSYMSGTCTVNINTVKPTVTNVEYTRLQNGSTWTNSKSIQGITTLRITNFQYNAAAGSPRAYYEAIVGSETRRFTEISSTSPVDIVLKEAGNISFKIAAVDERGARGESEPITLEVLPYSPPQITSYSSTRCNVAGADDVEGTYFKANISTQISPIRRLYVIYGTSDPTTTHAAYVEYGGAKYYRSEPGYRENYFDVPSDGKLKLCVQRSNGQAQISVDGRTTYYNDGALHSIEIDFDYDYNIWPDADLGKLVLQKASIVVDSPALDVSYKATSDIIWSDGGTHRITGSPIYPAPIIGDGDISPDSSYDIKYSVSDRFTKSAPITVQDYLSSAQYTLFLAKGGKAISVGEAYTPTGNDKVLNISNDWVINRSGEPSFYTTNNGWTVHNLGDGYVEMWGKIVCGDTSSSSQQVLGWIQWAPSDIYYSATRWCKVYPNTISFAEAPLVTATVRTYYTPGANGQSSKNHPNLWLVTDAQDSNNTEAQQLLKTPDYVLARGGPLTDRIDAEIALHVFGKLATS